MAKVKICIYPPLSIQMGLAEGGKRAMLEQALEPGACIRDLIMQLADQYPALGSIAL